MVDSVVMVVVVLLVRLVVMVVTVAAVVQCRCWLMGHIKGSAGDSVHRVCSR